MRPTTNPGAGSPSMAGTTGTLRRADFSSSSASVAGTTCATSTPKGARTSSVRMWKEPRARPRGAARSSTATISPDCEAAQHRRRSAHPHVDAVGRVADDLQRLRDVAELQRHAQAALDDVLAGDGEPQHRRQREREHLQPEMAERVVAHQYSCPAGRSSAAAALLRSACAAASRSWSGDSPRSIAPSSASEICPRLFGHDDRDGVAFLGQADRRAMPRAELAAEPSDSRSAAGSTRPPRRAPSCRITRAVVQRRARSEDRDEQIVGQRRVERNAALDVVAQADLALDRDDRARSSAATASSPRRPPLRSSRRPLPAG